MKILVTGTEGYIGSLLAPLLIENGHEVVGIDTGFYKNGWLYQGCDVNSTGAPVCTPLTLNKDLRQIEPEDIQGMDAIIHLAELSNDPAGQLSPSITYEINHLGSVRLARLAKACGVSRFIYTSSCSVYGVSNKDYVTESSPVNPQTSYATCKTLVERDVKALADDNFSPTFLRNATAYGASPRMRFDIVLNNLAGLAWTTQEIILSSDGTPWRPLVHVLDICQAILCTLKAPRQTIHNQIFNVGCTDHNYQIQTIAEIVADTFPGCYLRLGNKGGDKRSYRVSFAKIYEYLPEFACQWDAQKGAQQLYGLFQQIDLDSEFFEFRAFNRLKQLEYLIQTGQIDSRFFWQTVSSYAKFVSPQKKPIAV